MTELPGKGLKMPLPSSRSCNVKAVLDSVSTGLKYKAEQGLLLSSTVSHSDGTTWS